MCDPTSLAIASTVVGAAGSVASSASAAAAARKQSANVAQWQQEQKKFRQQEQIRQEQLRQGADAERSKGVEQLNVEDQQKAQSDEEARLAEYYAGKDAQATPEADAPISAADTELAQASSPTNSEDFRSDMAKKLNEATKGARQRLGAMARVASYGTSSGSLAARNRNIFDTSGRAIDAANEKRRGSLGAFGLEKDIDPVEVTASPSPLGDVFSAAFQLGTQGMGNAYGNKQATALSTFPSAPAASKFIGPAKPLPKYLANTKGLF